MRTVRMTQQLLPGDFALVISGSMLGESVELQEYVQPWGLMLMDDGRVLQFLPAKGLACWRVKKAQGDWTMKSPDSLMLLHSSVSSHEGAE